MNASIIEFCILCVCVWYHWKAISGNVYSDLPLYSSRHAHIHTTTKVHIFHPNQTFLCFYKNIQLRVLSIWRDPTVTPPHLVVQAFQRLTDSQGGGIQPFPPHSHHFSNASSVIGLVIVSLAPHTRKWKKAKWITLKGAPIITWINLHDLRGPLWFECGNSHTISAQSGASGKGGSTRVHTGGSQGTSSKHRAWVRRYGNQVWQ